MTLPKHTDELCFSTDSFLDENFTVDDFVNQCRKRVTIECLRDDLDAYYRTLKSAMVDLINKDYADFVNLSSNLVGVDKSIDGLATPLEQLKEEVLSIKEAMDAAISAIETKLSKRMEIRTKKATVRRLMVVMESLKSLERLLKIRRTSLSDEDLSEVEQLAEREEFAAVVMERVASEFNRLQYSVSHTDDHPLIAEITPRVAAITSSLQARLERSFQTALGKRDREGLTHCLQAYASINRQEDAETMFQSSMVHPYMEKVISPQTVLSGLSGLSGMYSKILDFFPKQCSLLLELTHPRPGGKPPRVTGFQFMVSAVWPETVALIDERIPVIFAPGNPDTFHKNYTATMGFVSAFEALCPTKNSVKRLRTHPSFTAFLTKWSLPVYFQIRFQEIAGALENALSLALAQASDSRQSVPQFKLELFRVLWGCVHRCWASEVFLPALVHRFWKLTLQLMTRTSNWLSELLKPDQTQRATEKTVGASSGQSATVPAATASLSVAQNLHLIHDCQLFSQQVQDVFSEIIFPRLPLGALKDTAAVQDSMREAARDIDKLIPQFFGSITAQVSQTCCRNLEPAHTIPRLYRRTNREAPQGVSNYVGNILKPLMSLQGEIPANYEQQWRTSIIEMVTGRYYEITSEVLTSVKRTEDSLFKLRRNRQSLLPAAGMSDDNKIRLQLALDIEEYNSQLLKCGVPVSDIGSLGQLLETGRAAKTLALIVTSQQAT